MSSTSLICIHILFICILKNLIDYIFPFASHVSLSETLHTHTWVKFYCCFHIAGEGEDTVSQILWLECGGPWTHSLAPEPLLLTISWNRLRMTWSLCVFFPLSLTSTPGKELWQDSPQMQKKGRGGQVRRCNGFSLLGISGPGCQPSGTNPPQFEHHLISLGSPWWLSW